MSRDGKHLTKPGKFWRPFVFTKVIKPRQKWPHWVFLIVLGAAKGEHWLKEMLSWGITEVKDLRDKDAQGPSNWCFLFTEESWSQENSRQWFPALIAIGITCGDLKTTSLWAPSSGSLMELVWGVVRTPRVSKPPQVIFCAAPDWKPCYSMKCTCTNELPYSQ